MPLPARLGALVGALAVALGACGSPFEVEIPAEAPRLVVKALFAADSLITLDLGRSAPAVASTRTDFDDVTTATVRLFEDGVFVGDAPYVRNELRYVSAVRARAGRTYRVEIEAPGFEPVSAEDAVPLPPAFEVVAVGRGPAPLGGDSRVDPVTVEIADPAGPDAYALYGVVDIDPPDDGNDLLFPLLFSSADPTLTDGGFLTEILTEFDAPNYLRAFFRSDPFDGQTVRIEIGVRRTTIYGEETTTERLRLARLSETYYAYVRAREADRQASPFSEVTRIPSNVDGGYGIFAAFAATERVLP